MGRDSSRSRRSSDESATPLSVREFPERADAAGSLERPGNDGTAATATVDVPGSLESSAARLRRIRDKTRSEAPTPGPNALGSAAERLQRLRERTGPSARRIAGRSRADGVRDGGRTAESLQRSTAAGAETTPAGETRVPDAVREVVSSPGRSLDPAIQRAMEDRMGDPLGDVRIHTGPKAARACQRIDARAFTVGNHVAFDAGEYDPASPEGQHVLAHELAHVRQQTGGAVSMLPQEGALEIDPDPRLEREAEETARRVMEGGDLGSQRLAGTDVHVQRMPSAERLQRARERSGEESGRLALAEKVSRIERRLSSVERSVSDGSTLDSVGKATTQGAVGAVGGLLGAVGGTMVSPGVGTVGGAAVGTEIAKGVAGDVTKTLAGKAYESGTDAAGELAQRTNARLEQLVEQTVKDVLSGSDTGSSRFEAE